MNEFIYVTLIPFLIMVQLSGVIHPITIISLRYEKESLEILQIEEIGSMLYIIC
jgi:hypothetical protein